MNFPEIYKQGLFDLLWKGSFTEYCTDSNSIGTGFGLQNRRTLEIYAKQFCISDIRSRIFVSEFVSINYAYLMANFIYLLSGEKKIEMIQFYNKKGKTFCDDGENLNASFGYRIFSKNQINYIIKLLIKDPSSRRAIIQIGSSQDITINTRDFPCLNYLHFLVRDKMLVMLVNMRSQSAFKILPYDYFIFSMLQEIIALQLNIEVGEILYYSGSYHVFEDELINVQDFCREETISIRMKKMDYFNENQRKKILEGEYYIRNNYNSKEFSNLKLKQLELSPFWYDYLTCLTRCLKYPKAGLRNLDKLFDGHVESSQHHRRTLFSKLSH